MLFDLLDVIGCMAPMWSYVLNYVFVLAFVVTIPCIIRDLIRR